ncbi:MAG: aspartate--tRNA ligase [Spirochaetota bacterium]
MESMRRTATCGELRRTDAEREVVLNGWVHRSRDHGGVHFINVRDRYGITQVVVDEDAAPELQETAAELKHEYCIAVRGTVRPRPAEMINAEMPTGEIEIQVQEIRVLSACRTLPFMVDEASDARDELRQKYRYLDLRSFSMQRKIRLRHDVSFRVREYLYSQNFYEIETPTLIKSTPEGARDFLVPSRLHQGKFYALPQSPQLFKQIIMVSGFDRYFQLAHCFRDEDARGDRQPEHTQIDIEMSFVNKDDVFAVLEGMLSHVFEHTLEKKLETPFRRISYSDAMNRFGTDKPDLRFGLELKDFSERAASSSFKVFNTVVAEGGVVKAVVADGCGEFSRKQIDGLESVAKIYGAKGLAWTRVIGTEDAPALDGGIGKFFADEAAEMTAELGAKPGDLLLFVADTWKTACTAAGAVRSELGRIGERADPNEFAFAWIVDFPLFEWNDEAQKWDPAHHMFTMPQEQFLDTLEENPGAVLGDLYDLVCNGLELASGSIRIHDPGLQERIFSIVGFSREEAKRRFGFLLEAFEYGPPPHGGIAPGLDRLVMLMAGEDTIREVIPFPKNSTGASPMDDSPSEVDPKQLEELGLQLAPQAKPEADSDE